MKKLIALLLAIVMILAFVACDKGKENSGEKESGKTTEKPTESVLETEPDTDPDSDTGDSTGTGGETDPDTDTESETDPDNDTEKGTSSDTEKDTDTETETDPVADSDIRADIDYYLAVEQSELGKNLYFDGNLDGYYPTSTKDKDGAVKVRLENVDGRFYLYFIRNAVRYYVNITMQGKLARISFDSEPATVFTYDASLKTLVTAIDGGAYYLGMYDTLAYFTASDVKYASESFIARLCYADCAHPYIADADGHTSLACAKCKLPEGEKQPHGETVSVREKGKKTTYCKECGYIIEIEYCDGFHWLSDAEGHWEGACDICGTPDLSANKKAHSEVSSEFVSESTYSMGCSICAYAYYTKDLTNVENMITAYKWGITATTYYQLNNGRSYGWFYFEDGDVPYGRITGSDKIGQILFNRNYNDTSNASEAQQYTMDVGNSKFLLIKIRTNDPTQHMKLSFSTTGKNGIKDITMPLSMLTADEWGVIAIDLAATAGDYYTKDAQSGTYIVDSCYFTMNDFESATNIDIAYMAFFDGNVKDIKNFVEEGEVLLMSGSSTVLVDLASGACTGDHSYNTEIVDGYYVGVCPACGDEKPYGVKAEDVKHFISPDYIQSSSSKQGTCDLTLKSENGIEFVRLNNFVPAGTNDKWGGIILTNGSGAETGKYMIMKVRIGENGLNQSKLAMFIRSTGSGLVSGMGVNVKVSEDGEWHVIVLDLSTRIKDAATYFGTDEDGLYRARYIQIRPFSNNQVGAQADDYMDIAYIAFCDELDDVLSIVSDKCYEWSVDASNSELRNTTDHGCAEHSIGDIEKKAVEGGTIYTATCQTCGKHCYEKKIGDGVTMYYTGKDIVAGSQHFYLGTKGSVEYDAENGAVYGTEGGNRQIIWARAQVDCNSSTRSSQLDTFEIGNPKLLVIRLKTSSLDRKLTISYSTTKYNSPTAIATADNPDGYDINGNKGIEIGETYATGWGYKTVTIPIAATATEGEWITYAIELEAVFGEIHSGAEGYVMDTLLFDITGEGELSFEFMAFVECKDYIELAEQIGIGTGNDEFRVITMLDGSGPK